MRVDVHQHLWSEPLVAALAARAAPPRVRRARDGWWLDLDGEPPCRLDLAGEDVGRRTALVHLDGLDRALVALSSPLGIEGLAPGEAAPVLDAYHAGVAALPEQFGGWASVALRDLESAPAEAEQRLAEGFAGVCVPAGAVATPAGVERLGPLLDVLDRGGAPLFVHPGPDPWAGATGPTPAVPAWWPALTSYVEGLHAAWHAFAAVGRAAHPELRVVFAALAGGAPLHLERIAARGGPMASAFDPLLFYETSSYGPRMVDAMLRVVGVDQLVHGSDRPVVTPPGGGELGPATWDVLSRGNPGRLLAPAVVAA